MLHSPFKVFLAGFGSVYFSFGSFIAGLPESMRDDQSSANEKEAQDSIGLDLELKDLVRFGQMLELALIPDLPRISHARKQRGKLLLTYERKLFEPCFCRRSSARSNVEFDSERHTVIDQPT
jgi:hypothetical protein